MNKYNPNTHHRRSIRLKGYDYSQAGMYFITICCQDRACLFGEIVIGADDVNPKMRLNEMGIIAQNEWLKTPFIRPNVELGDFVVMPNHIHGIIIITGRGESHSPNNIVKGEFNSPINFLKDEFNSPQQSPLRSPSNNIGAIIRGYKSSVTKQIRLLDENISVWQRNYYEHIIKTEKSFENISNYIVNNPANWNDDKFYR
jgi:REP element-mobilizing transposase RayT